MITAVFDRHDRVVIFNRRSPQKKNTRVILAGSKAIDLMASILPGGITKGEYQERKIFDEADLLALKEFTDFSDPSKVEPITDPWEALRK